MKLYEDPSSVDGLLRNVNMSAESQSADSSDRRDTSQPSSDRKDSSLPTNQAPQTLAQQSSINNNLLIDVDFEGSEDTMGDLQSPQYVKRTAHMFDSRFSSEPETNGHERNARNPSYLNVSRSVSGYSCLSYNNGSLTTETVTNKTILGNGASLITSGTRVSPAGARIKTDFSLHSPFTRGKVPHTDDDSSDHSSNQSATSPPPSLPPINTTSAHGRITDSPFFQNGINRGEDLIDDTPYIPSHGKSFIMQRIERLYGSDAVSSKGAIRKSSNVTTISISREPAIEGKERIIPIKVESRDDHQINVFNNDNEGVILPIICSNDESGRHVEPRCTRLPINDSDEEETDSRSENRRSPSKSLGHLNGNANRYRNDGNVTKNGNEVRANVSPTERKITSSLFHANASASRHIEEDCNLTKKVLSRESSAGSVDSNECSDNSLELGSISSEVNSQKSLVKRLDSTEDGITSSGKPKPKPKPKDMALLRTVSRSPGLKTGTENLDKTAILSMVQHDIIKPDSKCDISSEDQTDGESYTTLSDIKNTITTTVPASSKPSGKTTPAQLSETIVKGVGEFSDKENAPHQKAVEESPNSVQTPTRIVKDGNYFLNEMKNVTTEILKLAEKAAVELETIDESEDRAGSIHAAIGKGNLLVKKKFPQFEGLCHANLKGSTPDEPETTNEDLAGFWDMVMIQVDQVYSLFADLEKKDEESAPKTPKLASPKRMPASTSKSVARPTPGATSKVNSAAAKARDEARRKLIAERRKAMKNQMQETQESDNKPGEPEAEVLIFTPGGPQTG